MKSYPTLRNLYGTFTKNTTAANLTLGDQLINDWTRKIGSLAPLDFMEKTRSVNLTASTASYDLSVDYQKMISVVINTGSNIRWPVIEVNNKYEWDLINRTLPSANIPTHFFIIERKLKLWPQPSTTYTNGLEYAYKRRIIDLSILDYTTGTVDIVTNASTTITGSGTTWTAPMIGRFIRIDPSNVTASSGDGYWYEINTRTSNTVIDLVDIYRGTSLITGAGATYTIGQMSVLPEEHQDLPVYKAASIYWYINNDPNRGEVFNGIFTEGLKVLLADHLSKTTNTVLNSFDIDSLVNPNLSPTL